MVDAESHTHAADADRQGRAGFAATVVVGHALKHLLTSGVSSVLMPEIKASLSLSNTQVGSLGSVSQFSGWFATMAAGYVGDRFTRNAGMLLGLSLAITGTALLLLSFSQSYLMLVAAMLLAGLGPSIFHPPAIGALSRRFSDRRSFAISLHGTGGSIGEVLGPLTAAGMLLFLYWRDALRVSFVPAIIGAFLLWRLLADGSKQQAAATGSFRDYLRSFSSLLRQRALLMLLLVTVFRSVGQATTSIFLPLYLRNDLGYSAGLVGIYIALSQLAGIGSQPLMGFLSDRLGHKRVIVPALLIFAVLLALIPLASGKLQVGVVILALGAFVFSMQSILTSAAVEVAGQELHSTVVSLVYASGFVGSLAPTFAGALADSYGLPSVFYFSACLAVLATIVMLATFIPRAPVVSRV